MSVSDSTFDSDVGAAVVPGTRGVVYVAVLLLPSEWSAGAGSISLTIDGAATFLPVVIEEPFSGDPSDPVFWLLLTKIDLPVGAASLSVELAGHTFTRAAPADRLSVWGMSSFGDSAGDPRDVLVPAGEDFCASGLKEIWLNLSDVSYDVELRAAGGLVGGVETVPASGYALVGLPAWTTGTAPARTEYPVGAAYVYQNRTASIWYRPSGSGDPFSAEISRVKESIARSVSFIVASPGTGAAFVGYTVVRLWNMQSAGTSGPGTPSRPTPFGDLPDPHAVADYFTAWAASQNL